MKKNPLEFRHTEPVRGAAANAGEKVVDREEDGAWIGYLEEYPDYWTQGETLDDLKARLRDLHADLTGGEPTAIRKVDELVLT